MEAVAVCVYTAATAPRFVRHHLGVTVLWAEEHSPSSRHIAAQIELPLHMQWMDKPVAAQVVAKAVDACLAVGAKPVETFVLSRFGQRDLYCEPLSDLLLLLFEQKRDVTTDDLAAVRRRGEAIGAFITKVVV